MKSLKNLIKLVTRNIDKPIYVKILMSIMTIQKEKKNEKLLDGKYST